MTKTLLESLLSAKERFVMSRNTKAGAAKPKVKTPAPIGPDKEVWHKQSKKWLAHDDPAHTVAESAGGRSFSSTQIDVTPEITVAILKYAKQNVPDKDLAADGREKHPHITIKYGLHTSDAAEVAKIFRGVGPISYRLGAVSKFECADFDVLKIEIISPQLKALNAKIAKSTPCTDTHPTYKPHATIAYVRKGFPIPRPSDTFEGMRGVADTVTFSTKDDRLHQIKLNGG